MSTVTQTRQRPNAAVKASVAAVQQYNETALPLRVPSTKPSFTVADLRRAIPPHCFERSLILSYGYILVDVAFIAVFYYLFTLIPVFASNDRFGEVVAPLVRHVLWIAYWVSTGAVMTGLWVIGHECGHGGFADSSLVNDITGFFIHSALLVPFFAWKISHRRHHSNTGSLEHDEVFVPTIDRTQKADTLEALHALQTAGKPLPHEDHDHDDVTFRSLLASLNRLWGMFIMLVFGWPFYLIANVTANETYPKGVWVNHFDPKSPIFNTGENTVQDRENARLILISDLGLLLAFVVLGWFSYHYTFAHVFYVYGVPYLITNFWLVTITFLQHTDHALPHYSGNEWDWLRGALATVDCDYGIFNLFHHHIADTHVLHHLFSYLPHYHAEEATEAIKPLLGEYYRMDRTPWYKALWSRFGTCKAVKPDITNPNVFWF